MIRLEELTDSRRNDVLGIDRSDISEDWVDSIPDILALHQYGLDHGCIGHTYAIYAEDVCIGIILMGFVIDKAWRGKGLGSQVLEAVISRIFGEFGPRSILIGVQQDNVRAADFYLRHGFRPTDSWDEDDRFYIRDPQTH